MEILSGPSCSTRWLCQQRGERLAKPPHTGACAHEVEGEEAGRGALQARGGHPLRGLRCSLGKGLNACPLACSKEETPLPSPG